MKILFIILFLGEILMANHLSNSHSPYLLQHKDNPVDWYEWGDEAFEKAKKENKLIFLSIGYSTCHWCHQMAKESFMDKEVAKILNKYYVSIKVDKEQMPHIDNYYQLGYRITNKKGGGWPLTVIMTPDRKPVFFGTYLPKNAGYGSRGLIYTLKTLATYDRNELEKSGTSIEKAIENYQSQKLSPSKLDDKLVKDAIKGFKENFDYHYFGFSDQPKFPQSSSLEALLYLYKLTSDKKLLSMLEGTLNAMAKGGIYDQIDGGFYRYSVDRTWEIPHFEKMLYTNAELLSIYAKMYKITKNPLYKRVVDETIKEIDRRFLKDEVYFSASNADSPNKKGEEVEGYFFVVDFDEAYELLIKNGFDKKEAEKALKYFGIEDDGNFDGEWSNPRITADKQPKSYEKVKKLLKTLREKKEYPFIDRKINTAWNSMMIKALFECGYTKEAENSLEKLLELMYKNKTLYHQTLLPFKPSQKALLEDFAFLGDALFEAYQVTLDEKYLKLFKEIVTKSLKFYEDGKWRESDDGFKTFASFEDNNYKSELSVELENLLKLSALDANLSLSQKVKKTLFAFSKTLNSYPSFYPSALKVALMIKDDLFFVKSSRKNLMDKDFLTEFEYPFVYKEAVKEEDFLLCGLTNCFKSTKTFDELKKQLK